MKPMNPLAVRQVRRRFQYRAVIALLGMNLAGYGVLAYASGHGTCSAQGTVARILDAKAGRILVKISGPVQTQGDSAGCVLKDGIDVETSHLAPIQVGSPVQVMGSCSNGMTAAGARAGCGYSSIAIGK